MSHDPSVPECRVDVAPYTFSVWEHDTRSSLALYTRPAEAERAPRRAFWARNRKVAGRVSVISTAVVCFAGLFITLVGDQAAHLEAGAHLVVSVFFVVAGVLPFVSLAALRASDVKLQGVDMWRHVHPASMSAAAAAVIDVPPQPCGGRLVPPERVPDLLRACEAEPDRLEREERRRQEMREREERRAEQQELTRLARCYRAGQGAVRN